MPPLRIRILAFTLFLFMVTAPFPALAQAENYRTWTASNGKFSVEAKLLTYEDGQVKLLKKTDGLVVTVPAERLSEEDRRYLDEHKKMQDNPFAGGVPNREESTSRPKESRGTATGSQPEDNSAEPGPFELSDSGKILVLSETTPCQSLESDPQDGLPTVAPGEAYITNTDAYDRVSEIQFLGDGLVAVGIGRNKAGQPQETMGRIFVGELPRGTFENVWQAPEAIALLDHNRQTGQTLAVSKLDFSNRGGELVVMQGLATGKPRELYRRWVPGHDKPGFKPQVVIAKLVAKDTAVVLVDSELYCWNLATGDVLYRTESRAIPSGANPTFSQGGAYLAIPKGKGFHLLDTESGEDLGYVSTGTLTTPGVSFHPDGRRVAFVSSNQWGVWDLAAAKKLNGGVTSEHLGSRLTGWIADNWFMTELGNVIDSESEMLIWMYYTSPVESRRLWNGSMSVVSKLQGCKIQTLPIPEERAQQAVRQLDRQRNLMITAPGTQVRVEIETIENVDEQELKSALSKSIERAGWKINSKAKLAVVAKVGRGESYKLEFTERPFGSGLVRGETKKVTIKPFTATLEIREGNQVLWSRETENHIPRLIFLKGNETVKQAVKAYERPQPEFFSSMLIPPRIPKQEFAKGLGGSRLDKGVWSEFNRR